MKIILSLLYLFISTLTFSQTILDNLYGDYMGGMEKFTFDETNQRLSLHLPITNIITPNGAYEYLQTDDSSLNMSSFISGTGNILEIENYIKGNALEYTIRRPNAPSGDLHSVILAGVELNHDEVKGRVLVILDQELLENIQEQIDLYREVLTGDGWRVSIMAVDSEETAPEVKNKIRDFQRNHQDLRSLFVMGQVAIPLSGAGIYPDGHNYHSGAWVADGYYADLDYNWSDHYAVDTSAVSERHHNRIGDGKFDHFTLPSKIELEIGRLYFENLTLFTESRFELYARYLEKNVRFRTSEIEFNNDYFYHVNTAAFPGNMHKAMHLLTENAKESRQFTQTANTIPIDDLTADSYLYSSINGFGAQGGQNINGRISSSNFINDSIRVAFATFSASNIGNWGYPNNLMNVPLASKSPTLTSNWGLYPLPLQYLQSSQTFGYCHRKGANNDTTTGGDWRGFGGSSHHTNMTLWGDPTLKMYIVKPVSDIQLNTENNAVNITWNLPQDNVLGANIYRSTSVDGKFEKVNDEIVSDGIFQDETPSNGSNHYIIRTVKLDSSATCSYFNYSYGSLNSIEVELVDLDQDGFFSDVDCDDNNDAINPDAIEIPDNGIDEDCDGNIDELDIDLDGYDDTVDCNDQDAAINPDAEEIVDNGIDEDCDGEDGQAIICFDIDRGVHDIFNIRPDCFGSPVSDVEVVPNQIFILDNLETGTGYYFEHCTDYDDSNWKSKLSVITYNNSLNQIDGIQNSVYDCRIEFAFDNILPSNISVFVIVQDGDDCQSGNYRGNGIPRLGCAGRDQDDDGYPDYDDCDDSDAGINPGQTEIPFNSIDEDCNDETQDDDGDQDGVSAEEDCDDENPNIFPGNIETINGIDDNCNGLIDELDSDLDGYANDVDCDDSNPEINPGSYDQPNNGIDEDCDGVDLVVELCDPQEINFFLLEFDNIDCAIPSVADSILGMLHTTTYPLIDGVEYKFSFCGNYDPDRITPRIALYQFNNATQETGFFMDVIDSCSISFVYREKGGFNTVLIDLNDALTCDYTFPAFDSWATFTCIPKDDDNDGFSSLEDCDDTNENVNPSATEIPYNGLDDDCDITTLDDDFDQDGFDIAIDCNDNDPNINPFSEEVPYNGIDEDCNPMTLDDDLDQDGFNLIDDCDDTNESINPDSEEIPNNGIDEDCDGMDETTSTIELGNASINIYPNPTFDRINIDVQGQLNFQANLYSSEGKLMKTTSNSSLIEVNNIPSGIYLLEIKDLSTGYKIIERIIIAN